MRKAKASLIATIAIGLLAISTAGVSTYAWFQATSQVQIQASGDSTTITVAKPDDYEFYAYNGNKQLTYTVKNVFHNDENEANGDFTLVTSSNRASLTSLSGMYPGQSMIYCIGVSSVDTVKLNITSLTSNDVTRENHNRSLSLQNRYFTLADGNTPTITMNVGWAMDVFETHMTSVTAVEGVAPYKSFVQAPSGTDHFQYDDTSATAAKHRDSLLAGKDAEEDDVAKNNYLINLNTPIPVLNFTKPSETTVSKLYIFYSVTFSSSVVYTEVNGYSSTSPECIVKPDSGTRYFRNQAVGDVSPNSNCFADLSFQLNSLELLINK